MMELIFLSLLLSTLLIFIFYIVGVGKKKRKTTFQSANFSSLSCESNGIIPSPTDKLLESWKCPDISYFFAGNKETLFQLTLKKKNGGCFFVVKFSHGNYKYENCGFLEEEIDGFRYLNWLKWTTLDYWFSCQRKISSSLQVRRL